MNQLIAALRAFAREDQILVDEPMSRHTTFRVGGPADVLFLPESAGQFHTLVSDGIRQILAGHSLRFRVIRIKDVIGIMICQVIVIDIPGGGQVQRGATELEGKGGCQVSMPGGRRPG